MKHNTLSRLTTSDVAAEVAVELVVYKQGLEKSVDFEILVEISELVVSEPSAQNFVQIEPRGAISPASDTALFTVTWCCLGHPQ